MKKFLALVLALVMTMSLVTISAGAEDFTDDSKITYSEAVDVMTAIEVVGGYADGSFNPTAGLTRGAAAKIICNMILGPTTAEALSANNAPFSDVAVDNVFAGYIAYCANEGIISGYADGTFRPAAPLTGYAFMKMLLGALGYDAVNENYVGSNWSIQVAKRALAIGLDAGLEGDFVGAKALTREEACLYAFNTLKATMVEYENDSKITVGDIVVSNSSKASDVKAIADRDYSDATDAQDSTLEFCEKYFKTLKLDTTDKDGFARPAHSWDYEKEDVGTYAETPDFVYVNEFCKEVKEDLEYDDYSFVNVDQAGEELYYNGDKFGQDLTWVTTNSTKDAANGFTVELYDTNDDKVFDKAIVIEQYFAQIDEFTAATSTKDAKVTVLVMERSNGTQFKMTVTDDPKKDTDMYNKLTAFEEGQYVAVTMKQGWDANATDGATYVKAAEALEAVEGVITRVNVSKHGTCVSSVVVDGTTYYLNSEFVELVDTTVYAGAAAVKAADKGTLYLDAQGCVIGWVAEEDANDDKHIAITEVYKTLVDGKIVTSVTGVLATGETATFTLEGTEPTAYDGNLYKFDDADKDGKYEFSVETLSRGYAINDYEKKLGSAYYAKDVKFVFVDCTANDEEVTVLDGVQDVASATWRYIVAETDAATGIEYVNAVFVIAAPSNGNVKTEDIIFVNGDKVTDLELDTNGDEISETYYVYSAYVNGEKVEDYYAAQASNAYTFYKSVKSASTGAYSLAESSKFENTSDVGVTTGAATYVAGANTITINGVVLGTSDATIVDVSANENGISYVTTAAAIYDMDTKEATIIYLTATT